MINLVYDVIIIGAGPVGSYLAYKLSISGKKILVVDKKSFPGQNVCCTGIISRECFDLLGVQSNVPSRPADSAIIISPGARQVRFWRNENVAGIIDRPALEVCLTKRAESSGVEYRFNHFVEKIVTSDKSAKIFVRNEQILESKVVVIATGYGSNLPLNSGLGRIKEFWIGAQVNVEGLNVSEVQIYLDRKMAPGGFAWLVPTFENKGLAGLITGKNPESFLKDFISYLKLSGKIECACGTPGYAHIPLKPLAKTFKERLLVVGEAAGQVKPITGGGIYYGLACAQIASSTLCKAFERDDFSTTSLSQYQKLWQKKLMRELQVGYYAQRFFAGLSNSQIEMFISFAKKRHLPDYIAASKDFSFDAHSKLLLQTAWCLSPFVKRAKPI